MLALETQQRQRVVVEARRWIATPYHHRASLIGVGVDCAQLVLQAFAAAELIDHFEPGSYSPDWHLHRSEEKYLEVVERYASLVDSSEVAINDRGEDFRVEDGDILMWRVGRTFSHSAIVSSWPFIIHAYLPSRIVEEVDVRGTPMSERPVRIYSYWGSQ
jgi:NlpC/P60 family putative phage cell wall peptidase